MERKAGQMYRMVVFLGLIAGAWMDLLLLLTRNRFRLRPGQQARYVHRWAKLLLRGLGIKASIRGNIPKRGLIVCNHLSYLDILVLGAARPMLFVAKSEVRNWPVLGMLTKWSGNLFIQRDLKMDLLRVEKEMERITDADVPVTFFPEGTSTDGSRVLPFKSSLFIAASRSETMITPAHIAYSVANGNAGEEICYWGEMTFFPHLMHLFSLTGMEADLVFGGMRTAGADRKVLAKDLYWEVLKLGGKAVPELHRLDGRMVVKERMENLAVTG